MDAVVIAGGSTPAAFPDQPAVTVKALLSLNGRSLLERTVGAIRASRAIARVCVVGPPAIAAPARRAGADLVIEGGGSGIDNLLAGVHALGAVGRILCSASDLPCLRADDVDDLIERTPAWAQLSYPIFTRKEWDAYFPGAHATFIRLSDGEFAGGCVFVLGAAALCRIEPLLQRAFAGRKSLTGMARLLGTPLALRCMAARVLHARLGPSTERVRRKLEALTACRCAIVRGCSPRTKADVDDLDDWLYAIRAADAYPVDSVAA